MQRGGDNIHLSRNQPDIPTDLCSGTVECALAGFADHVLILIWLLVLIVVAVSSLVFLPRAEQLCDRERRRATVEFDAFDQFLSRLQGYSSSGAAVTTEPVGGGSLIQQQAVAHGDALAKVREAYRETVMAVPHFEEDYDESLIEHMSAELGEEIAYATVDGGPLSEPIKRGLLAASRDARDRRADFIELLDEESESLNRHTASFEDIHERVNNATSPRCANESFNGLHRRRDALLNCSEEIESTVAARQQDRTEGRTAAIQMMDGTNLQEYLYRPMEVTYPVLGEGTRLLSQIQVSLRRIEDELIYRS